MGTRSALDTFLLNDTCKAWDVTPSELGFNERDSLKNPSDRIYVDQMCDAIAKYGEATGHQTLVLTVSRELESSARQAILSSDSRYDYRLTINPNLPIGTFTVGVDKYS